MRRSDFHGRGYAGIYKIPPQHLLGSSPPSVRPSYNTMDFFREEQAPEADPEDALETAKSSDEAQEPKKHKDKTKKQSRLSAGSMGTLDDVSRPGGAVIEEAAHVVNAIATERKEKKKEKRRHSKEDSESKSQKEGKPSEKKRKRKSEAQPQFHSEGLEGHIASPTVDKSALHDVQSATPNSGDNLVQSRVTSDKPSKKKIKSHRKSAELNASQPQDSTVSVSTPVNNLSKKSKKAKDFTLTNTSAHNHLHTQAPGSTAGSPYITTPKKTPVPLPQRASNLRTTAPASSQDIPPARDEEVLVVETPPSKLPSLSSNVWKTPIRPTQTPVPAPRLPSVEMKGNAKLTRDNLMMSRSAPKESLNDASTSQQRYRRSGSVSSASSMSIKDAFSKMRRQSLAHTDDIDDPFVESTSTSQQQKRPSDNAKESFETALLAFRSTVDFSKEREHLATFLQKRIAEESLGPLPCLHQATGCNPSQEKALTLARSNPSPSSSSQSQIQHHVSAYQTAESLLSHTLHLSLPIPTGEIQGLYTLFCPSYLAHHVDRHAGARTLTISRPAGFRSNTFVARLSLPPRPMAFNIRAFSAPAHASFRGIELLTADEGVGMELSVVGNGYVVLRMDVCLLLSGRRGERNGGNGNKGHGHGDQGVMMEFYGVKEKDGKGEGAVEWGAVEAEVRRRMNAERKEGGKAEVEVGGAEGKDVPTPRKRGRPSKAEVERRAMEKEREMAARGGF